VEILQKKKAPLEFRILMVSGFQKMTALFFRLEDIIAESVLLSANRIERHKIISNQALAVEKTRGTLNITSLHNGDDSPLCRPVRPKLYR